MIAADSPGSSPASVCNRDGARLQQFLVQCLTDAQRIEVAWPCHALPDHYLGHQHYGVQGADRADHVQPAQRNQRPGIADDNRRVGISRRPS